MPLPVMYWRKVSKSRSGWLRTARRATRLDGGGDDAAGEQPVEANAGAGEDAGAHAVEAGERRERGEQDDGQHHQRDDAAARHHAVVDLQHVKRRGEVEQVDGEAEQDGRSRNSPGTPRRRAPSPPFSISDSPGPIPHSRNLFSSHSTAPVKDGETDKTNRPLGGGGAGPAEAGRRGGRNGDA